MSRKRKLPKAGDKTLSAEFLKEMSSRVDRNDRLTITGGELSSGPAGTAIIIPPAEPSPGLKLVRYGFLPAAWGGPNGRYPTNELAISYGNYIPDTSPFAEAGTSTVRRRIMYGRTNNQWAWNNNAPVGVGSAAINVSNETSLQIFNPYDLPLNNGWAWAQPMNPDDEYQYMIVAPLSQPWGARRINVFQAGVNGLEMALPHDEPRLLRGLQFEDNGQNNWSNGDWVIGYSGGDVMLPFPGHYEVTFGAIVGLGNFPADAGIATYTELDSASPSAGTFHTHKLKYYDQATVTIKLQKNYKPGDPIGGFGIGNASYDNDVLSIPIPPEEGGWVQNFSAEKTIIVYNDTDPWHGGAYTRLSLIGEAHTNPDAIGFDQSTWRARVQAAWMVIKPALQYNDVLGGGCQQFPTGYSWPGLTGFQWWGGGPQPQHIYYDGTVP